MRCCTVDATYIIRRKRSRSDTLHRCLRNINHSSHYNYKFRSISPLLRILYFDNLVHILESINSYRPPTILTSISTRRDFELRRPSDPLTVVKQIFNARLIPPPIVPLSVSPGLSHSLGLISITIHPPCTIDHCKDPRGKYSRNIEE